MKKILLVLMLVVGASQIQAQVKSVSEIAGYSTKTFYEVKELLEKKYWKKYEEGKMDTLDYTRWVPVDMNDKNIGDNIMCFYKKKDKKISYIVLQTNNVAFRNQCRAEVKKGGYQQIGNEKKKDEIKESYLKGKCNVTIFQGKQNPTDPVTYLIGAKII